MHLRADVRSLEALEPCFRCLSGARIVLIVESQLLVFGARSEAAEESRVWSEDTHTLTPLLM